MLPLRRLLYQTLCICCCCFVACVTVVAPSATLTSMRCLLFFTYCLFTASRRNSICAPLCCVTICCRRAPASLSASLPPSQLNIDVEATPAQPVTTYLHPSALLLPNATIRMAALSALFRLCVYYLSLLRRRACLVTSMITAVAPSAMPPLPDLLSSRLLLGPSARRRAVGRWFAPVSPAACM